jgi:glycosyltransferase involved in cell wall biosynthesis
MGSVADKFMFKKRKIALVISSMRSGGAERVMANLANYWAGQGHDVTLVTFVAADEVPFYHLDAHVKRLSLNCLEHSNNPLIYLKNIVRCLVRIRRAMKVLRPDAVVSFLESVNMAVLMATLGLRVPVIISERIDPAYHRISKFYAFGRLRIYRLCLKLIVQTKSVYHYFPKDFATFMEIIPNPVPKPSMQKTDHCETMNHIVTVGRLNHQKNHETLIRAFAKFIQKNPDAQLTIFGEGEERASLENLIEELNVKANVKLPGAVKDVLPVLIDADAFVFPSLYEGFPNALCEAMSVGLPVIASNVTGNRDLVVHGENGLLFEAMDENGLYLQLQALLDVNERSRLAAKACEVSVDYSEEKIYAHWARVLNEVCKTDERD